MKENFKNKLQIMEENKVNDVVKNPEVRVNDIGYVMSGEESAAAPTMDAKYAKPPEIPKQPAAAK